MVYRRCVGVCRPALEALHRDAAEHQAVETVRLGAGCLGTRGGNPRSAAQGDAEGGCAQGSDKYVLAVLLQTSFSLCVAYSGVQKSRNTFFTGSFLHFILHLFWHLFWHLFTLLI